MDRSKVLREIDVCKLLHSNSEECLELSSFCSILLSSTTNLAGSSNPASTADVVTHRHVWIDRGEGLRLNISIVFGPNLLCLEQREDIVNDLATKLVESQIWSQLKLRTSLISLDKREVCERQQYDLVLSLQKDNEGTSNVPKRHAPVVLNTTPPSGVATASLEEVNFEFNFRGVLLKDSKSKKRKTGTQDPFVSSRSAWTSHKRVEQCSSTSQPNPILPSITVDSELDLIESASQPLASTSWEEMLDDPAILTDRDSIDVAERLVLLDVPGSNSEPELTVLGNQNQRKRILPEHDDQRYQPNALTILKLLNVGLRTTISSSRVQSCPGITLNKKSKGPKLAEIAPVLFSPDYRQAISYRNHLLPSIARSVSAVYRHTKSADLREKMDRLCEEPLEILYPLNRHIAYCGTQNLDAAVRDRLWIAAQRSLFDPSATRNLKVFDFSSSASQLWHDKDEILDKDSPPHLLDDFETSTLQEGPEDEDLLLSLDWDPDELLDQVCFSEDDVEELLLEFEEDELLQD